MKKTNSLIEEDQPLLFSEGDYKKEDYWHTPCENLIAQGAVRFLGKWPSHLCAAFLAGSFIIATIFIFILITIFFLFPAAYHRCREVRNVKEEESYNVYFVKHENRTWSSKELCYIEAAARKHPELNVYLINLVTENPRKNSSQDLTQVIDMKDNSSFSGFLSLYEQEKMSVISRNLTPEMYLRKKIAYHNANVRNVDISTERFFRGSIVYSVYKRLSNEILEIAAKANILWNYPGIVLNPILYNSLDDLKQYFCDKNQEACNANDDFMIKLKGDLLASNVPCHMFAAFLMKEITKNRLPDQQNVLKQALNDFCPRIQHCLGVRILKIKSSYLPSGLSCPTIYPDGLLANFEDALKKTTKELPT